MKAFTGVHAHSLHSLVTSAGDGGLRMTRALSAFVDCPEDVAVPIHGAEPGCIDNGGDCATDPQEFRKLRAFGVEVDDSLRGLLNNVTKHRQIFERRVNDYIYSGMKSSRLTDSYGPDGPMKPGGSYLYAMKRWLAALHRLKRACFGREGGCSSLVQYLKNHPEDDTTPDGRHGKANSKVWDEFRIACQVGRTRSPVPNDSPIWCSARTGLCEHRSMRLWWKMHQRSLGMTKPLPWVDDRADYEALSQTCHWMTWPKASDGDLIRYQMSLTKETEKIRDQYCKPRWIEGYCEPKAHHTFGQCNLGDGKMCEYGIVSPHSSLDGQVHWKERYPEDILQEQDGISLSTLVAAFLVPPTRSTTRRQSAEPAEYAGSAGVEADLQAISRARAMRFL